ncbi:MAG: DNA-directed RNA polymerase subunit P [ANME-2 cluster archaeon]|jgi:DNA-directed RNA polymerase subunit P|nr:DNA-directed RNA polymerase subunit P [ANME-2 cluster archaeon]MCD4767214.1 DNA-directed RNA polymerase subunit P [Methanosarcinales archaeon]MBC2698165.1 DNA-directed RNA polymerase subunit P [ANME-2 cluster archaeon]MBC2702135.1 DNA-directed RNA polymerase subunit P [ANME-2 cluster archaeon]MBC2708703.1 DNA-directed RNA polymerase subunit P [ANME-2 cluster archaeon]
MVYYCTRCKRLVEIDYEAMGIRCPYCGHRILIKQRPTLVKRVEAV